jgi:predicted Rdx family selenoprotein
LAASIEQRFNLKAQLVRGQDGVFDVHLNGELLFSKHAVGRFPEGGEVERAIQERLVAFAQDQPKGSRGSGADS